MIPQNYVLLETAPFTEFTSVTITDDYNLLFDVEKIPEENLQSYCQNLIFKIFQLKHSDISVFLKHHSNITTDPVQWLNKFEMLIIVNEELFHNGRNKSRLIKFQTCIELERLKFKCEETHKSPLRPSKRHINAESEDRYFSFKEVKEKLNGINVFEEKIVFLTHQKYDYQLSNIDFVNRNLPNFDKQCDKEIDHLFEVKKIEEHLKENTNSGSKNSILGNRIRIHCNLNQIVDVLFQLNRELFIEGKPFLDGNTNDFVALICNNFVDKEGHEISPATVGTILRPSKDDKRPKSHRRIDLDKLI